MAAYALAAYKADTAVGKDALLVCDTTEMADALNQRIHHETIAADAPTIIGARGHRVAVGDLILSRRNHSVTRIYAAAQDIAASDPVRNGDRWQVAAIDTDGNSIVARRLSDGARAVFEDHYVREHITYGYAVTVHSAQRATADTTHAVLGETATRSLFYVAVSRGRDTNTVYLHQHSDKTATQPSRPAEVRMARGTGRAAAHLARAILGRDDRPATAHNVAADTPAAQLPDLAAQFATRRVRDVTRRRSAHRAWQASATEVSAAQSQAWRRAMDRFVGSDAGLEL